MTTAWDVYDKLFRSRGYGRAMWSPAPHDKGAADIADVGWIWDGRFYRFINAAQSAQSPINHGWHEFSQPEYEPIEIDPKQLIEEPDFITAKALGSSSVSARIVSAGAHGHGAGFDVKVKCGQQQAALLLLPDGQAQRKKFVGTQIKDYIRQNEPKWWAMAQLSKVSVKREELIFVTGWVKTSDWELAVCTHDAWSGEVSLKAGVGHLAAISFSGSGLQEITSGWECKSLSPELKAKTHGNVHCVFLQYCKIKHRLGLWPRMKAAAEPQDPPGANDDANEAVYIIKDELSDSRQGFPLEHVPEVKRDDPVDDILDYILENAAAAGIAFATTQDVACLLRMNTNTNEGAHFRDIIRSAGPVIEVDETGMGFLYLDEHQGANMWTDPESSSTYIDPSDGRSSGYSIKPAALTYNDTEVHDPPYYDVEAVNNMSSSVPTFMFDTNSTALRRGGQPGVAISFPPPSHTYLMAEDLQSYYDSNIPPVVTFTEGEHPPITFVQARPLSECLSYADRMIECDDNEPAFSQWPPVVWNADGSPSITLIGDYDQQDPAESAPKMRQIQPTCDRCRALQVKCSGDEPTCFGCALDGSECTWSRMKDDEAAPSSYYVQELETRLRNMESILEQVTPILEQVEATNPELSGITPSHPGELSANVIQSVLHQIKEISPSDSTQEPQALHHADNFEDDVVGSQRAGCAMVRSESQ